MMPPALRNRDFRLFVGGMAGSVFGSEFTTVAMAWQVYQLTDSPLDVGLLGLARAIPQMALLLIGGLLADALDRRRLMMIVQAGQFAVSTSLLAFSVVGAITPAVLFAAAALLAVFTALETPCRQALLTNLVTRDELAGALALNNALRKAGAVGGPSLAGLALAFGSASACYAVDAVSWLVMLGSLALIRVRPGLDARRGGISLLALKDGLRFVLTHPIILTIMSLDFGATLFGLPNALFPVYARDILQVGPQGLGILYAAASAGAIVGGIAMSAMHRIQRAGVGVLVGVAIYAIAISLFSVSPWLWLSALLLAISGIGNTISAVLRWTISQWITPDDLRGRVASVNSIFTTGGPQLGQFRAGVVAESWGAEMSALTGGFATLALVAAIYLMPRIRTFQLGDAPEPATGAVRKSGSEEVRAPA